MEYKLASSDNKQGLEKLVNSHLEEGWELHGSPQVVFASSGEEGQLYFYQALIFAEKQDK